MMSEISINIVFTPLVIQELNLEFLKNEGIKKFNCEFTIYRDYYLEVSWNYSNSQIIIYKDGMINLVEYTEATKINSTMVYNKIKKAFNLIENLLNVKYNEKFYFYLNYANMNDKSMISKQIIFEFGKKLLKDQNITFADLSNDLDKSVYFVQTDNALLV